MKLKNKPIRLKGSDGDIDISRNESGIPVIEAQSYEDMSFGQGWVHGNDRQVQTLMLRILLQGRAAECLKNDEALIEIDTFMRQRNFVPDAEQIIEKLNPDVKQMLKAYTAGLNLYLSENKPVFEYRLLGYQPEPWELRDSLLIGKAFGYVGLADAQGGMEKFLVQMIQNGIDEAKLRELFPYLKEEIDVELFKKITLTSPIIPETEKWLGKLPRFTASNNWVVSGKRTQSGKPIMCGDPHLEINRLPSILQEIVMRVPENNFMGVSVPGIPGLVMGRTDYLAWSATYSFMDMIDYRIEECRDGQYKRGNGWKEFKTRPEIIKVKKNDPIEITVYENEHGLLEGDPTEDGHYLVQNWPASQDCGADEFNGVVGVMKAKNVSEAMKEFSLLDASSMNWVIADVEGNIGYQMSGRCLKRPAGISGILPLPGWEEKYDADGYLEKSKLPSQYNPEEGYIVTANQDLNHLGEVDVINLPMGTYRAERIKQLIEAKDKLDVDDMKAMHYDLFSTQAEKFMDLIRPLLPDTENGRILKKWDLKYDKMSLGATLFESVYLALINVVFGDNGLGREVVSYILKETGLFNDYYANLDNILFGEDSAWYEGKERTVLFKAAIEEGLDINPQPYRRTRKVTMAHLLLGGQVPGFLGFDHGPIELPGNRATIPQGQIFESAGRTTTFSPCFRMIADMATGEIHTNMPGGPTDRRFSKWYTSDLQNWFDGNYKVLK